MNRLKKTVFFLLSKNIEIFKKGVQFQDLRHIAMYSEILEIAQNFFAIPGHNANCGRILFVSLIRSRATQGTK